MVTCAVFLRLNSVLKLAILLIMIAIYAVLTEAFYTPLFIRYDTLTLNQRYVRKLPHGAIQEPLKN